MALPTAEQVTNMYLYGQKERPEDLLDPSIANRDRDATSKIDVDVEDYMTNGAGRFVNSANFDVVLKFFTHSDFAPNTDGYTPDEILEKFGMKNEYSVHQMFLGTDADDYAKRTFN